MTHASTTSSASCAHAPGSAAHDAWTRCLMAASAARARRRAACQGPVTSRQLLRAERPGSAGALSSPPSLAAGPRSAGGGEATQCGGGERASRGSTPSKAHHTAGRSLGVRLRVPRRAAWASAVRDAGQVASSSRMEVDVWAAAETLRAVGRGGERRSKTARLGTGLSSARFCSATTRPERRRDTGGDGFASPRSLSSWGDMAAGSSAPVCACATCARACVRSTAVQEPNDTSHPWAQSASDGAEDGGVGASTASRGKRDQGARAGSERKRRRGHPASYRRQQHQGEVASPYASLARQERAWSVGGGHPYQGLSESEKGAMQREGRRGWARRRLKSAWGAPGSRNAPSGRRRKAGRLGPQ